jgi:hypothetical protein
MPFRDPRDNSYRFADRKFKNHHPATSLMEGVEVPNRRGQTIPKPFRPSLFLTNMCLDTYIR